MRLFTIGFTRKTAEQFFGLLVDAGVQRVIDIRLNNTGQLAGFTRAQDLPWFLEIIGGIGYRHEPLLAPTDDILKSYRKDKARGQAEFERRFKAMLRERKVDRALDPAEFDNACLLCSEHEPEDCHRSLVAAFLGKHWGGVEVVDLV
jgi:uncharacterized protein (DUF488 family)